MKVKVSTRVVFLIGRYAVKIPIDRRGWLQGLNERKLWRKYGYQSNLIPVKWSCGGVVIQQRATPMDRFKGKYVLAVKKRIPELDINGCDLYNPANWGIYRGNIYLLDYGITERVSKMYTK